MPNTSIGVANGQEWSENNYNGIFGAETDELESFLLYKVVDKFHELAKNCVTWEPSKSEVECVSYADPNETLDLPSVRPIPCTPKILLKNVPETFWRDEINSDLGNLSGSDLKIHRENELAEIRQKAFDYVSENLEGYTKEFKNK